MKWVAVPNRNTKSGSGEKQRTVGSARSLADGLRRPYQRVEASPWVESLPVPRL